MFYEATIYIAYKRKKRANEDHELDADDDGESDSMDDDDDDNNDVNPNDNKPILWWSMEHTNWSCVCVTLLGL